MENTREQAMPVVGLACVARPTFAVDYAAQAAERVRAALMATGWPVAGDATLLMDAQAARDAAHGLQAEAPDVLVILCATFSDASMAMELAAGVDAPVCLWALREPGPPGDRLWLNSLCGAHIAAHALKREGRVIRYIYGDPGEEPEGPVPGVLAPLEALARAAATRNRLRRSRIGLVGQAPAGFYGCQYDELALARTIGTTVSQIDLAGIFAAATEAEEQDVAGAIASTKERSPSLATLPEPEVRRFGQAYVVLRDALHERQLDGLAVRCWPEFPQNFGLMPCATLGRLADDGFVCACEADMHGAVTLLLLQWLSGAAPLLTDLVAMNPPAGPVPPEGPVPAENTLTLWHCGNAPACLARDGDEPILTTHCNRRIGVAGNFAIRSGPATVARLSYGPDGYRLFFVQGELLDTPANRFQGNTAVFRPRASAPALLDSIIMGGLEHHVAVVAGHLAPELRALAEILNIGIIGDTEHGGHRF